MSEPRSVPSKKRSLVPTVADYEMAREAFTDHFNHPPITDIEDQWTHGYALALTHTRANYDSKGKCIACEAAEFLRGPLPDETTAPRGLAAQINYAKRQIDSWSDSVRVAMGLPAKTECCICEIGTANFEDDCPVHRGHARPSVVETESNSETKALIDQDPYGYTYEIDGVSIDNLYKEQRDAELLAAECRQQGRQAEVIALYDHPAPVRIPTARPSSEPVLTRANAPGADA